MTKPIVVFVVGPTASGKTELAVKLAKHFSSAVISADSMQIYQGMHIASAAPDADEMCGVPHKMLEFLPYGEVFTVADYADMARKEIDKLLKSGKIPVVAGGTGLYINALADNIRFLPVKTDSELREKLSLEYDKIGGEEMLKRLFAIDSEAAEKLNPADKRRIVRAFEIYESSGLTKSEQNALSKTTPPPFHPVMMGVAFSDRQKLYDMINARVDIMIERGLLTEARTAYEMGLSGGGVQAIGHKEFFDFFEGKQTLDEAVESLKRSTRRYAKRQITWFGGDSRINWIYRDKTDDVLSQALKIIESEAERNA